MEDIVRGALEGIAIEGFAAAVVVANRITMQALWRLNCLAAETSLGHDQGLCGGTDNKGGTAG